MEFYVSSFCSSLKDASTIHSEVSEKKVFYVFRLPTSNRWGVYHSNRKGVIKRHHSHEGVLPVESYAAHGRTSSTLWGSPGQAVC